MVPPQSKQKWIFELVAPKVCVCVCLEMILGFLLTESLSLLQATYLFAVESPNELLEWFTVIQELQAYVMNMTIGYDVKGVSPGRKNKQIAHFICCP